MSRNSKYTHEDPLHLEMKIKSQQGDTTWLWGLPQTTENLPIQMAHKQSALLSSARMDRKQAAEGKNKFIH